MNTDFLKKYQQSLPGDPDLSEIEKANPQLVKKTIDSILSQSPGIINISAKPLPSQTPEPRLTS